VSDKVTGKLRHIPWHDFNIDALIFVLLFVKGQRGYQRGIKLNKPEKQQESDEELSDVENYRDNGKKILLKNNDNYYKN